MNSPFQITGKLAKQEMSAYAKATAVAEEVFDAIRTVVGFGGQEKEGERYANNLIDARKINIRKAFFAGIGFGLLWFFIFASYALAFWYGVGLVIQHRDLPPEETVYTPGRMFTVSCFVRKLSQFSNTIYLNSDLLFYHDGSVGIRRFISIHRNVWYCERSSFQSVSNY